MLKAINTKILIAILAVLTTIAGLLVHQHGENQASGRGCGEDSGHSEAATGRSSNTKGS